MRALSPQEGYYERLNVVDTIKSFVVGYFNSQTDLGPGKTHRAKALGTVVGGTPAFALLSILKPHVFGKGILLDARPARIGSWLGGSANALRHGMVGNCAFLMYHGCRQCTIWGMEDVVDQASGTQVQGVPVTRTL